MIEVLLDDDGSPLPSLWLDADRISQFTSVIPRQISILRTDRPERRRAETYLEAAYSKAFSGHIERHFPILMCLSDHAGQIDAVVGLRFADRTPLYLEHYLDEPVEQSIERNVGERPQRHEIAEIGNLASDSRGAAYLLFLALAAHLEGQGCTHAVATATCQLRRGFSRVGFKTSALARADASRLGEGAAAWGDYYQRHPEVLVGAVAPALPYLQRLMAPSASSRLFTQDTRSCSNMQAVA